MSRHPEQQLWQQVKPVLQKRGHAVRVENPLDPGMPDVSYSVRGGYPSNQASVEGWLELKVATRPLRSTSRLSVDARPAQRVWWARPERNVYVLLALLDRQTARFRERLLFDGPTAARLLRLGPSFTVAINEALNVWDGKLDDILLSYLGDR